MIDIVNLATAILQTDEHTQDRQHVILTKNAKRVLGFLIKARIHLHPSNRRQIVAIGIEEQPLEKRVRAFQCWRLTGAHDTVDVDKRLFTAVVAVGGERAAKMWTVVHIVDEQNADLAFALIGHALQHVLGDLVTSFSNDFTSLHVDEIIGKKPANQILIGNEHTLNAGLGKLAERARCHLSTGGRKNLARFRINQVPDKLAALQ